MTTALPASADPGPRPLWVPPGIQFEDLPPDLQGILKDVISPAYHELVLSANSAFERLAAVSYVHLAWMELVEQLTLGKQVNTLLPRNANTEGLEPRIHQFLRIVAAKDRSGRFLLELQRYLDKAGPFG